MPGPLLLMLLAVGCGKKGPPLPPLVRLPAAPQNFVAVRRGSTVAVQFVVPSENTDRTAPADLAQIDVYAMTGPSTLTPAEILSRGTKVGSVVANPPRDPDAPEDETDPAPKSRQGLDQGAIARLSEAIAVAAVDSHQLRSYLAVGVSMRGRRGAVSTRALVPLVAPPPSPRPATVEYDETGISVTWSAPSLGIDRRIQYHVYQPGEMDTPLTDAPLDEPRFIDRRVEWGATRCYTVRTVDRAETVSIESEPSTPTCVTLADTFPPAAPTGLRTVPDVATVNLVWTPNSEPDLAGYVVLRAIAPATTLGPVNSTPTLATTLRDTVPSGARVIYAVQAVDKMGNASPMSERMEETAR